MSEFDQPIPLASMEGRRRREQWDRHLAESAAAMTAASMQAHEADHRVVTAGQGGLYGSATPQQMAADVAARAFRAGDGAGAGRELVALGGYDFESQGAGAVAPIPARRDLRFVDQHQPPGESPLAKYMRERQ